jgi:Lipocalin-like domain
MNKTWPRILDRAWRPALLIICLGAPIQFYASARGAAHSTREDLIGAWRLQSIQLIGPNGPMVDPFYNEGSTGMLIYDRSGWMSVQIAGQSRAAVDVPASRPLQNNTPQDAQRKAQALDTYYAYYGTWDFDEAASTVTHHIVSSLFPAEAGVSYPQKATLDGELLTFTTQREFAGNTVIQKKVWQRVRRR